MINKNSWLTSGEKSEVNCNKKINFGFTLTPKFGVTLRGKGGFTVLELILVIAFIGILVSLTAPFYKSLELKADLSQIGERLVSDLRRQQTYANLGRLDNSWGVKLNSDSYILFKGNSFLLRDTSADEPVSLPKTIRLSNTIPISEIVFNRSKGDASNAGQITLTGLVDNQTLRITIFSQGLVQLN